MFGGLKDYCFWADDIWASPCRLSSNMSCLGSCIRIGRSTYACVLSYSLGLSTVLLCLQYTYVKSPRPIIRPVAAPPRGTGSHGNYTPSIYGSGILMTIKPKQCEARLNEVRVPVEAHRLYAFPTARQAGSRSCPSKHSPIVCLDWVLLRFYHTALRS